MVAILLNTSTLSLMRCDDCEPEGVLSDMAPLPSIRTNLSEHAAPSGIASLRDRDRHGIEGLERRLWSCSRVRNGEIIALHALLSRSHQQVPVIGVTKAL